MSVLNEIQQRLQEKHDKAIQQALTSPAFKKWFGGSKVVEDDGTPQVMYHGTKAAFKSFDPRAIGTTDDGLFGKGFYVTYNPEEASGYALSDVFGKGDRPNVIPVYIALKDPLVIVSGPEGMTLPDGRTVRDIHGGTGVTRKGGQQIRDAAEKDNHDGILLTNKNGKPLHAVAFSSNQIKSIHASEFDTSSEDIGV